MHRVLPILTDMRASLFSLALCLTLLPGVATHAQRPKPGPEHQRLAMRVGHWSFEETIQQTPLGPAARRTGTIDSRMILGGFFLENRGRSQGTQGSGEVLEIVAYDPDKQRYQGSWFDSAGNFDQGWKGDNAVCTIEGNVWTWTWFEDRGPKRYHCREIMTFAANRKSCVWETAYSLDGTTWHAWKSCSLKKRSAERRDGAKTSGFIRD